MEGPEDGVRWLPAAANHTWAVTRARLFAALGDPGGKAMDLFLRIS
jgi:hypothetical protein